MRAGNPPVRPPRSGSPAYHTPRPSFQRKNAGGNGLGGESLETHCQTGRGGYVAETKARLNRKPHTDYRLTPTGRNAFKRYQKAWRQVTGSGG